MDVELSWEQCSIGALLGIQRQLSAMREGRCDAYGMPEEDKWKCHIEGACGEIAFAKAVNRFYSAPVDTFKVGGDGVGSIQVRTRLKHEHDLIVRSSDSNGLIYVLVTGTAPRFRVHGWIYGRDARRPEWVKDYGGRPSAWFVPKESLQPVNSLPIPG